MHSNECRLISVVTDIQLQFTRKANKVKEKRKTPKPVKYPHLRRAAANMGYNHSYIYRVLERQPGYRGRPGLAEDYWAESARIEKAKKEAAE